MDIVLAHTEWTSKQIIQINSCRRYLQAQTLADICTLQGTRLLPFILNGYSPPQTKNIRIATFNQKRPHPKAWQTWKRFLLTISNKFGILHDPLDHG